MNENTSPELFETWSQLCHIFSTVRIADWKLNPKGKMKSSGLDQISGCRKGQKFWTETEALLEHLSAEEVTLLLTLSKSNQVYLDTDFKVYTYLIMTIPAFVAYTTYQVVQYFGVITPHISGAIWGAAGLLLYSLIFGSIILGKSLNNKFRNLEMTNCLEGIIVYKKSLILNQKIAITNSSSNLDQISKPLTKNDDSIQSNNQSI
jgi:hypothetical protein